MSGDKKSPGDLVFNDDFDKEPEQPAYVPPSPPPPPPAPAQTAPPPTAVSTSVPIPEVDDDAAVPSVTQNQPGQSYRPSEVDRVTPDFTSSTAVPVTIGTIQEDGVPSKGPPDDDAPEGRLGWISLKTFQKYFDVDDKQVLERLLRGLRGPFNTSFLESLNDVADLYGPFWIVTTLVFLTAVSNNISSYSKHHHSKDKHGDWDGDYSKFGEIALMYYIYFFGVGLLLYFTIRFSNVVVSLTNIWCLYGYGMVSLLPTLLAIALVQFIGDDGVRQALTVSIAVIGASYSVAFIALNLRKELTEFPQRSLLLLGIVCVHLVIGFLIALYFH